MRQPWQHLPLRLRLTLWYVVLLALTVLLFGVYLHVQLERRLITSTDGALTVMATQMLSVLDEEAGQPQFEESDFQATRPPRLDEAGFAARLLTPDGAGVWDGLGAYTDVPMLAEPGEGYSQRMGVDSEWRVLMQPVRHGGQIIGWLEVAQSLDSMEETLGTLRELLVLGLPLILLLAGGGGFFLAERALRPIKDVTLTARGISASDLSQRLNYGGPPDEVGQLARTFDEMLDRLQVAWTQERRFTADAAHELRTPLTVLKGQIEVTRSRARSPNEYELTLDQLKEQVERLIRLSSDLLFLTRLDQARPMQVWEEIDLGHLLASLADQIAPLLATKQIQLTNDVMPHLLVYGESDLLIRLFLNLLQNAYQYTPEDGQVTLGARKDSETVRVSVTNTGSGIPAAALAHLFDRFYRVEEDRSRNTGGAGLGLAMAREIAHVHGGTITVESDLGKGTIFVAPLPHYPGR
ncbi:MAG: HAMP domain-containing protein [Ardenticatenales bacterium]|nr:HAMP domain-containing protein [Ardenticatenales bacterium]